MAKVWKDANEVIRASIEFEKRYKEIKKVMEEAPNGIEIKPKSRFRKSIRVEKY